MKYLITILALCLCSACATRKQPKFIAATSGMSRNGEVRTPEIVKAYPAGRYTDPDFPDDMHERHTVYRREQSANWNYRPSEPYALPLGPTVGSSPYDVKTDGSAQQRAYAEALLEQNRAMKARIESMQQEAGKVEKLEKEIEQMKKTTVPVPSPVPTPSATPPEPTGAEGNFVEPPLPVADEITDPCEILLFANSDDESQAFLLSQMRLNDEFAAELATLERRKRELFFPAPLIRRKEFAFLTKNIL